VPHRWRCSQGLFKNATLGGLSGTRPSGARLSGARLSSTVTCFTPQPFCIELFLSSRAFLCAPCIRSIGLLTMVGTAGAPGVQLLGVDWLGMATRILGPSLFSFTELWHRPCGTVHLLQSLLLQRLRSNRQCLCQEWLHRQPMLLSSVFYRCS